MKDYNVFWNHSHYPEVTREYLGILPEFFIHATQALGEDHTLDSLSEAMDEVYGYGGFQYPFGGTVADCGTYLDRFTMYCYPYAITAIRDNDTGETKIGRFD